MMISRSIDMASSSLEGKSSRAAVAFPETYRIRIVTIVALLVIVQAACSRVTEEDCRGSTECLELQAMGDSLESDKPVRSETGAMFFRGERCTSNCAGHMAGFRWAKQNHITERWQCAGNSESFLRGCHAYLDEVELDAFIEDRRPEP